MLFCPLCSGSSGNAAFLEAGGARMLVDAGVTAKRLSDMLSEIHIPVDTIDAILITHEHSDHVAGAGVLARRYGIPVYADADCFSALPAMVGTLPASCMRVFEPDQPFLIKNARVLPFSTPHDAAHAVGYRVEADGRAVSVMTDVGHIDERLLSLLSGSDLLLIEANHDVDMLLAGPYPYPLKQRILSARGHLCNEDCARALIELHEHGVKNVILGHLSRENNTPELALVTVETILETAGVLSDMHVTVARRDAPCGMFEVG